MYRILINQKNYELKQLHLTVFVLQYNIENKTHIPLPLEKPFFLSFLLNNTVKYDSYIRNLTNQYIQYTTNDKYTDTFITCNANHFISQVDIITTRNSPFQKWLKKYSSKSISHKNNTNLVQADYIVTLTDSIYMEHLLEGFFYDIKHWSLLPNIEDKNILSYLPNIEHIHKSIEHDIAFPTQFKFSANNDYLFQITDNNKFSAIETNSWDVHWQEDIQDSQTNIFEDTAQNIVWLQDYDEALETFEIKTGKNTKKPIQKLDYFMSPKLSLMTHLEEKSPLVIYNQLDKFILKVPEKTSHIQNIAFSCDEKFIAIAYDKEIDLWNIHEGILVKSISFDKGVLHKIIFNHDSNLLFILANHNIIYALDIQSENIVFTDSYIDNDTVIEDFDITDKFYAILLKRGANNSEFYGFKYKIYNIGYPLLELNQSLLFKFQKEAESNRDAKYRWANFLKYIPYNKQTSSLIDGLKQNLYLTYNWTNLGVYFDRLEQYEMAIEASKIALEIRKKDDVACYNIGTYYMYLKQFDSAIKYFNQCLEGCPDYYNAYINLGSCLSNIGEHSKAEEAILKYIESKPYSGYVYISLSMVYLRSHNLEKAEKACLRGIELGNLAQCNMNLGHIYYVQNNLEIAEKYYLTSLKHFQKVDIFFKDMLDDFGVLALYNIDETEWQKFVESLKNILV